MKVKMIQAIKAYNVLENLNPGSLDKNITAKIWKNLKELREICKKYAEGIEKIRTSLCEDPRFDEMNDRISKGEDSEEIREWCSNWSDKSKEELTSLNESEVEVNVIGLPGEELMAGLNQQTTFTDLLELDWIIM